MEKDKYDTSHLNGIEELFLGNNINKEINIEKYFGIENTGSKYGEMISKIEQYDIECLLFNTKIRKHEINKTFEQLGRKNIMLAYINDSSSLKNKKDKNITSLDEIEINVPIWYDDTDPLNPKK